MDYALVLSRADQGLDAPPVRVEVHLSNGLPAFNMVGMAETAVRESKDRVRSALLNSHFEFPDRRITVNLAPADLPKGGGRFDLPIALGILCASNQLPRDTLGGTECLGELALDGSLRPVRGAVAAAIAASRDQHRVALPRESARLCASVPGSRLLPADHLLTLCAALRGHASPEAVDTPATEAGHCVPDLADVVGQETARRALEIAAAGEHNLLLVGPPGTGKSLLAQCLPGILPPVQEAERLTVAALHDLQGLPYVASGRPFRAPHHSASAAALVGGGSIPRPGEVSLAHGGVLFLDELPEFSRHTLDMLREPLETGEISLARAACRIRYPARFQLVAAMNPCPCGFSGDPGRHCRCSAAQILAYGSRVSGPLLDRIDLQIGVDRAQSGDLFAERNGEDSACVAKRVGQCQRLQRERQGASNARLDVRELQRHCHLSKEGKNLLRRAAEQLHLSTRAVYRTLRVARTIADLKGQEDVGIPCLKEALGYRLSRTR